MEESVGGVEEVGCIEAGGLGIGCSSGSRPIFSVSDRTTSFLKNSSNPIL